jgi:hypothetical protein
MLGLMTYCAAIGHLYNVMQTYNKIQIKFQRQQEKLIARHLVGKDLFTSALRVSTCTVGTNTCNAKTERAGMQPLSDILILHTSQHNIIYYLHKSIASNPKSIIKYALYRDNTIHQPQAIVENVQSLKVKILTSLLQRQTIVVTIQFLDNYTLEIKCTLPH